MAVQRSLKQWILTALLLASLCRTVSPADAVLLLFTGIDDLQPLPVQGNTQPIRVVSDLPFQYQLVPLNADQVLVRFLNAKLSSRLQTANGVLPIETGGSVVAHATLRVSEKPNVEEIVLIGEGLGKKKIILEGGEEIPVTQRELSRYTVSDKNVQTTQNKTLYTPSAFPSGIDNPASYVTQPGSGFQLPIPNAKRKQETATQEQLPQPEPVRLPRPSFQPEVGNQDIADNHNPGWQEIQEADNLMPLTLTQEPAVGSSPTGFGRTGSTEIELEHGTQSSMSSGVPHNMESALRPKSEVEAKPRLELSLENSKRNPVRKPAKPSAPKASNNAAVSVKKEMPSPEPETSGNKPVVHFPDTTPAPPQIVLNAPQAPQPQAAITLPTSTASAPLRLSQPNDFQSPNRNEPAYNALAYSPPSQLHTALETAKAQYAERRYEAAENTLEAAIQVNPKDAPLYAALGELYIEQHLYPNAKIAYSQAYTLAENAHAVRYAQVLVLTQQSQQAIIVLQKLLGQKNMPPNPAENGKAHYILGTLLEEQGNAQKALPHLQQAAQFLPNDADIHYNLALAYELTGNMAMAKAHYGKANQINPSAQDARQALGRIKKADR